MALIIPTSFSSYGDATRSEGNRVYVLAQFRDTDDLSWLPVLRRQLRQAEVKYKHFKEARPQLRADRSLWPRLEAGIGQATIVVVDVDEESLIAFLHLSEERGLIGRDFGNREMQELMAKAMISRSPLAFLPYRLMEALPDIGFTHIADISQFTPDGIRNRIGGGLRQAAIFAARAHAIFDVDSLRGDREATSTRDAFVSPYAQLVLAEILASPRFFDEESPRTVTVLNDASDAIAQALQLRVPSLQASAAALVTEGASHAFDHLQAADVAAGWAREIVDLNEVESLPRRFANVWYNGRKLR